MLTTWSIRSKTCQGSYHTKEHKFAIRNKKSQNINTKKPNQETKPKETN